MRRSASPATILFLIMLLLVVGAGFVFLFQTELRFRDQLRLLSAENDDLRAAQASLELELSGAEATREAVSAALSAAEQDNVLLEGQLVDSQQTVDELTGQIEALGQQVDGLEGQLAEVQGTVASQPPAARIVSPEDEAVVPVGRPVEIVAVASDASGLTSLTVKVDTTTLSTTTIDGERIYARTLTWNAPAAEGEHVLSVSAVNVNGITSTPQTVRVSVRDVEARNATIRADVEAEVIALRGLDLLEPVVPVSLTRDELRQRIEQDYADETSPDESRRDVLALSAFDFVARDFDLYQAQIDLQSEGIQGFYDPETAEFVVVTDGVLLDPAAQWTHAHEIVHALQDQHYDLDALHNEALDSEARAAVRALAEGEAELVQFLFLLEGDYFTRDEAEALLEGPADADDSLLNAFPPILVSNMAFPYTDGVDFVVSLYQRGGFDAIDEAWANPPRTTEQILHPERYLDGDAPQIVSLAPLTDTLGVGWEQIDEDILGEFFLREYLDQQLSTAAVNRAATGWGGDRYAVYWNEAGDALVMALRLAWDSERDAEEFASEYRAYPAALYDATAAAQADGSECWQGEDVICLLAQAQETFVVRAPDLTTAATVLAAIRPAAP